MREREKKLFDGATFYIKFSQRNNCIWIASLPDGNIISTFMWSVDIPLGGGNSILESDRRNAKKYDWSNYCAYVHSHALSFDLLNTRIWPDIFFVHQSNFVNYKFPSNGFERVWFQYTFSCNCCHKIAAPHERLWLAMHVAYTHTIQIKHFI